MTAMHTPQPDVPACNNPTLPADHPLRRAKWIHGPWCGAPHCGTAAPTFFKHFSLDEPVDDATLFWSCIGIAEVSIDGRPLHDGVFLPGWTDLRKRLRVLKVPLGPLSAGSHRIEATVGDGWAVGHVAMNPRQSHADRVQFIAALTWADHCLLTDADWRCVDSPTVRNDLLMGEAFDARLRDRQAQPFAVSIAEPPPFPLTLHTDPVVKRQEAFSPKFIGSSGAQKIYDIGQNIAGRIRLRVRGARGVSVILRHAEILNPDGSLYLTNLRSAQATDTYTLAGDGEESWEPSFTFHGFRFVSVETTGGTLNSLDLQAVALYSDMPRTGDFQCSEPLLNQLFHNIVWGLKGNFLEVPTDCPQRDERLGWTGDAQVFAPTAAALFDVSAFFDKWLRDLRDAQRDSGLIPCFAPDVRAFGLDVDGGPAWADAIVLIPWYLYEAYGDSAVLAANYPAMQAYMDFLARHKVRDAIRSHPDVDDWGGFGDWLALDGSPDNFGNTPKDLIGTAFYARDAELLAQIANILGKPNDAAQWQALHASIKDAFQRRFLSPDGLPVGATQTACILALHFNLLKPDQRGECVKALVRRIRANGPKIGTGFVGTPYILDVLEANGHLDLAYQLLERKDFPSWLFPVTHGATTIWERWDGWHPQRGFQDAGMNSFNHYAYGAVGQWMLRSVAGIAPAEPGYRVILFKPRPGGTLSQAAASIHTPFGRAAIDWQRHGQHLQLSIVVPDGCSAILDLPHLPTQSLNPGRHSLSTSLPTP